MILFSILAFLLIFSTLIIVHEFGHYYAAIKSGVKVEEFGLGMGKKLYGYQRGETEFTLNLIPFGGFVRMLGEEDDSTDPRSFGQAKLWKRMVITLAGVFMNFVMAITFLTILFTVGTDPILVSQADVERAYDNEVIAFSVNGERMTPDEIKALDNPDAPAVKVKPLTITLAVVGNAPKMLKFIPDVDMLLTISIVASPGSPSSCVSSVLVPITADASIVPVSN
jgi:RIP metalloprotease RseP